jgi:hypothetical protein
MREPPATTPLLTCAEMRALGFAVPPLLADVERALGAPAMHRLVRHAGGQRISVPRPAYAARSQLAESVGEDVALFLSETLGTGNLDVPLGPRSAKVRIVRTVALGLADGEAVAAIARRLGVHERTVSRIACELRRRGVTLSTLRSELEP